MMMSWGTRSLTGSIDQDSLPSPAEACPARYFFAAPTASKLLLLDFLATQAGHLEAVLVAAAGEADHDDFVPAAAGGLAQALDHGVRRFQGGQDPLKSGALGE